MKKGKGWQFLLFWILFIPVIISCVNPASAELVTFENGSDGAIINVSQPGIEFKTTDGFNWIYADWRTRHYNGPYPNGSYYSFGNCFAWLGPNQGRGRIDFNQNPANRVSLRYSSYSYVSLEAFDAGNTLLVKQTGGGNLNTGAMGTLKVETPGIAYVLVHDTGNYWLIDNLDYDLVDVQLLKLDLQEDANKSKLHTDKYESLVFRRASELNFNVVLSPGYDEKYYSLSLKIQGPDGSERIAFNGVQMDSSKWYVQFGSPESKSTLPFFSFDDYVVVPVKVFVPFDIPIGKYSFSAQLQRSNGVDTPRVKAAENPAYFIFNPWGNKDEDVFFSSSQIPNEYILSENGVVYKESNPKTWNFAQFDDSVFLSTAKLVEKMPIEDRGKAWKVARYLSSVANNSNAGGGVLQGNWSNNFSGGHPPNYWSDSAKIFDAYNSGGVAKYGQCWVFAAVVNSMSRTLGIPTRAVTNIPSAHDSAPFDGIITTYFGPHSNGQSESIWNFHVWNEAWLSRPDRNSFGGPAWQAFDGTPQELSGGKYQAGPAPVAAIKADAGGIYDVNFIRYEVQDNVQVVEEDPVTGATHVLREYPYRSNHIYTKDPFGDKDDLIHDYCTDCPQSSSMIDKNKTSLFADILDSIMEVFVGTAHAADIVGMHHVTISLDTPFRTGSDISGRINIQNNGSVDDIASVRVYLTAQSTDGKPIVDWGRLDFTDINLPVGRTVVLPFTQFIPVNESAMPGIDYFAIQVAVVGVTGTGAGESKGPMPGPALTLSVVDTGSGHSQLTAILRNPMSVDLLDVVLSIDFPPEVQVLEESSVRIGRISSGQQVEHNWTLVSGPGSHSVTVQVKASGLGAVYEGVTVSGVARPSANITIEVPDVASVGENIKVNLVVRNTGGSNIDATVNLQSGNGLGNISNVFQTSPIEPASEKVVEITVPAISPGVHSLVALANDSSLQVSAYASTTVTVLSADINTVITISPESVSAGTPADIGIFLSTNVLSPTSVTVQSIASSPDKRYAIYDGTQRILGQPITVPVGGKTLRLALTESTRGGFLRVTAVPVENPAGASSAELLIVGRPEQTVVDDRVSVTYGGTRYDRRTNSFSIPVSLKNISSVPLYGPVSFAVSGIRPSTAGLINAQGSLPDGRRFVRVQAEGYTWQPGEILPSFTLVFSNPTKERLDFTGQVLAVINLGE